jgi:ferrous-iron efflux pump FieF
MTDRQDSVNSARLATAPGQAAQLMRWATYASVTAAAILIVAKLAAWIVTGSVAMLTTLIDSLLDAAASVTTLLAVRHSLVPADADHRFGHGKAEALAGLAQAAFITGSVAFLLFEAGARLIDPHPVQHGAIGIAVMVWSVVVTLGLLVYQRYVVGRTGSVAITADALHYKGDVLTNLAVIAALVLTGEFGITVADPLFALGIALYLLWGAIGIFRDAYDHLMDREFPDAIRTCIREIVLRHPDALAMHDLRTRWSGTQSFIQFHLELDPHMPLLRAHRISDEIERAIVAAIPGAEVLIHEDPAGVEERRPDAAAS